MSNDFTLHTGTAGANATMASMSNQKMIILGFDPGVSGGWCAIDNNGLFVGAKPLPTVKLKNGKRELDIRSLRIELVLLLIQHHVESRNCVAYVEHVHAFPGQGVSSCFSFGANWGMIRGLVAALGMREVLVSPQRWMSAYKKSKKDKFDSTKYVPKHFPNLQVLASPRCKKPHDGVCDAVCIASYGYGNHM